MAELALVGAASEPVEAHVHGLKLFSSDVEGDDTNRGCIVRLYWCRGLLVSHLFKDVPGRDGFAAADEECAKLGLGRRCHDGFDHL